MKPPLIVPLGERSYPIHIGQGLLGSDLPAQLLSARRVALITNSTLEPMLGKPLEARLRAAGKDVISVVLPDGEAYKTHESLNRIYDVLLGSAFDRKSAIVALGGGVIGDMAGFAAATFQRGIPFLQVPTTLLSQVDSSVGGKTAINHPKGKNMIGAFHQPLAVIADTATLNTLPERELIAGLAEVIKYGLIRDTAFLAWLKANMPALRARQADALEHAIRESCRNKAEVVAADEFETGERAFLNLGHTFGHAIEGALGFGTWLHGEAVGVGMLLAARLSQELGHLSEAEVESVEQLLAAAGLRTVPPAIAADTMLQYMAVDKKNQDGNIRLVLLHALGRAYVDAGIPRSTLRDFLLRHMPQS